MEKLVVAIPCLNEEATIRQVVTGFRNVLPEAEIIVFDNGSTDNTVQCALSAGAKIHHVPQRGKGAVVQEIFRRCRGEVTLMVDGDATYPPEKAIDLVNAVLHENADMALGTRLHPHSKSAFRWLNRWGNHLFRILVNAFYGAKITDLLTGYRVFGPRFMESVMPVSVGFEIETELTLKALKQGFRIAEIPVHLQARPENSQSKIRVLADGFAILCEILAHRMPKASWGAAGSL